ncbi:putative Protein KIAA0317-like protein [Naja naja]|nr:putative Protein KIAA0317-like protein [Naja naja]
MGFLWLSGHGSLNKGGITVVSVVAFFFTIKFLFELAARVVSFLQHEDRERRGERTIYDYVRGNYLDPRSCKVFWDWKDPCEVGRSMAFRVHLFYKNGQPFPAHHPVGLRVHICHVELAIDIPVTQEVLQEPSSNVVKVAFTVRRAGRYEISVKLGGLNVAYSPYYKVFQPEDEKNIVERNVSTSGVSIYFEAYLYNASSYTNTQWHLPPLNLGSFQRRLSTATEDEDEDSPSDSPTPEKVKKPKKVYCYVSPKQFSVKEFYLKIIPWRLFTFRVCPGTKFSYHGPDPVHKLLTLVVDDGIQPPVELSCKERNILAATFIRSLHKNIGKRSPSRGLSLLTLKATRNFSVSDWSKNFEVTFQDEEALDWGGPRREWFELICKVLFDTTNQLFTRFSDNNQALVVELLTGGAQMPVTNENKILYLNLLAQYRLANQVREEVEHFLKGLNELVPENLLAIFDENELELLMCGTGDINVCDFKAHAVVVGGSWHFREKVMRWFWTVVSSFTQEELARLLQFTTGSSQLPPGDLLLFVHLSKLLQLQHIVHFLQPIPAICSGVFFNQLCLPTYDSYEEVHKMLQLAISEGCEGFGML